MSSGASILYTGIRNLITCAPLKLKTPKRRLELSDLGVIHDAALLVDKRGMIQWVGPAKDAPKRAGKKKKLDCETVLPGFVDAHTHLLFAGERAEEFRRRSAGVTYQQIASEGGGILTTMKATRTADVKTLLKIGKERLQTSKSFGVTTLEMKSGYCLNETGEKKLLSAATELKKKSNIHILRTYLGAHAFPNDCDKETYMKFLKKSLVNFYTDGLYDHLDMFTEEGYFTIQQSEELILLAKKHKIPFKIHADEFSGLGGARLGARLGALSVDHLLHYLEGAKEDVTLKLFSDSGTVPMFLPGTAFFLKLPYANPLPFLENGIPVALATDFNPGSCMSQNLPLMMSLSVLYMKMNVEEAVAATTIHAARALGLPNHGFLAEGNHADFQVYDCPYGHIVYEFGRPLVRDVYCRGKKIVSEGVSL